MSSLTASATSEAPVALLRYFDVAVLVIATPCPLLVAIPVAIISPISLCARRGIVVRTPALLEQVSVARAVLFEGAADHRLQRIKPSRRRRQGFRRHVPPVGSRPGEKQHHTPRQNRQQTSIHG